MNLQRLVAAHNAAQRRLSNIIGRSERMKKVARARVEEAARQLEVGKAGLNVDQIEIAKSVIYVRGNIGEVRHGRYSDQRRGDVRTGAVSSAIKDIAEDGCAKLRGGYVGVKNYDGFGDQREDHNYGMGPRHGSIVFEIGLTNEARRTDLTSEQTEAALYYLLNLADIQAAAAKAA